MASSARRRIVLHVASAIELVAAIEKFLVVAVADQRFQFRLAQSLRVQIVAVRDRRQVSPDMPSPCGKSYTWVSAGIGWACASIAELADRFPATSGRCRPPATLRWRLPVPGARRRRRGCGRRGGSSRSPHHRCRALGDSREQCPSGISFAPSMRQISYSCGSRTSISRSFSLRVQALA